MRLKHILPRSMPGTWRVLALVSVDSHPHGVARAGRAVLPPLSWGYPGPSRQEGAGPGEALSLPQPGGRGDSEAYSRRG